MVRGAAIPATNSSRCSVPRRAVGSPGSSNSRSFLGCVGVLRRPVAVCVRGIHGRCRAFRHRRRGACRCWCRSREKCRLECWCRTRGRRGGLVGAAPPARTTGLLGIRAVKWHRCERLYRPDLWCSPVCRFAECRRWGLFRCERNRRRGRSGRCARTGIRRSGLVPHIRRNRPEHRRRGGAHHSRPEHCNGNHRSSEHSSLPTPGPEIAVGAEVAHRAHAVTRRSFSAVHGRGADVRSRTPAATRHPVGRIRTACGGTPRAGRRGPRPTRRRRRCPPRSARCGSGRPPRRGARPARR
jgi:hypothetical protein